MTIQLSIAQIDSILANPTGLRKYAEVYRYILSESTENGAPKAGVDPAVWQWLRGAIEVNEGTGPFSEFIRAYTKEQALYRTGEDLSKERLDEASDSIAQQLIQDIRDSNGAMPSLISIGSADINGTVASVFAGDKAGWSGNLLFVALGVGQFLQENILTDSSNTYNAFLMAHSAIAAAGGLDTVNDWATVVGRVGSLVSSPFLQNSTTDIFSALGQYSSFVTFLEAAYGASAIDIFTVPLSNIFIAPAIRSEPFYNENGVAQDGYVYQEIFKDQLNGEGIIVAGPSDSTLSVVNFSGIIDGQAGFDNLFYSSGYKLTMDIGAPAYADQNSSNASYIGTVRVDAQSAENEREAHIYSVESIYFSASQVDLNVFGFESLKQDTYILGSESLDDSITYHGSENLQIALFSGGLRANGFQLGIQSFEMVKTGSGNDRFYNFESEAYTIDGGDGFDVIDLSDSLTSVTLSSMNIKAQNIEKVIGSDFSDVLDMHQDSVLEWLLGDSLEIDGGAGNDVLTGNDVANVLSGGIGNDTIYGNAGDDRISGGIGNDTILAGDDDYMLASDEDLVHGGIGDDVVRGGAGNDTLYGDDGDDVVDGGKGNDILYGGQGYDVINGGDGDDVIYADDGDIVDGGAGADTYYFTSELVTRPNMGGERTSKLVTINHLDDDDRIYVDGILLTGASVYSHASDYYGDYYDTLEERYSWLNGSTFKQKGDTGDEVYSFVDGRGNIDLIRTETDSDGGSGAIIAGISISIQSLGGAAGGISYSYSSAIDNSIYSTLFDSWLAGSSSGEGSYNLHL